MKYTDYRQGENPKKLYLVTQHVDGFAQSLRKWLLVDEALKLCTMGYKCELLHDPLLQSNTEPTNTPEGLKWIKSLTGK